MAAAAVLGRDDELGSLQAFLDRPVEGTCALVLEGEAGIGKSTLWDAGLDAARERGLQVLPSRPAEVELGLAHTGLGDLLEGVLDDVLPELAAPRRRALELALLRRDADGERVDVRTLAVAVRDALHVLAGRESLLIAIDDVQWLDASSAGALCFALRRVPEAGIRVLLTRRLAGDIPVTQVELAVDAGRSERLHVGPLSAGALQQIVRRRLGEVLPRPTLLRLHEASGGNPFFALELTRACGPRGDPTQPLSVPPSLETLVRARLDALPAATQETLLLVAAHALLSPTQLDGDALEPAFAEHVIEVDRGVVRFTHPLLASVAYQRASASARRCAHARLAEIVDDTLSRARHRALAAAGSDAEIAAELDGATALASAQGAQFMAADLAEHALRLTAAGHFDDWHRRAITAAYAQTAAGDLDRADALASELLAESPPGIRRAEALVLACSVRLGTDGLMLEALSEASGHPRLQAEIHRRLAWQGRFTHGLAVAEQHADASLALAEELDDDALRAGALAVKATNRLHLGEPDALLFAREAERLFGALDPRELPWPQLWVASLFVHSGRLEEARRLLDSVRSDWEERDEQIKAQIYWRLGVVELMAGRFALAADHVRQVREILQSRGDREHASDWLLAAVAAHRGDLDTARELALRALPDAESDLIFRPSLEGVLGTVALWQGDLTEAVARFSAAERGWERAGSGEPALARWRADQVEALLAAGRVEEAVSILDAWAADSARPGRERVLAQAARCRGLVASARGDVAGALVALERALPLHAEAGDPFGRARTLLALGIVRRRARQKRAAREAIEAAISAFEECGAEGWAETARAELGRISGRIRVAGLTAAEQRVAALVASGRTNREVATELFLGERTVASHLTHIYAKLGVRSRTELAAKVTTF